MAAAAGTQAANEFTKTFEVGASKISTSMGPLFTGITEVARRDVQQLGFAFEEAAAISVTSADSMAKAVRPLSEQFRSLGTEIRDQIGGRIGEAFRATGQAIQAAAEHLGKFGMQATIAGAALSALVTAPLVALAREALSLSANIELAGAAFTHMLGSAEAAGKFLRDLKQFALDTPFNFPELIPMTQRLRAFGFAAQEVIPTLKAIGDAVGLLAGGPDLMNRIALALGQMQASARLSAQDMRQLSEAGINAWRFLAEASGKSIAEIKKISEDAGLNGQAAARLIIEGMRGEFEGGMAKLTDTLIGQWNKVKEQISFALADIGDALAPFARRAIDFFAGELLPAVRELTAGFRELPEGLQATLIVIAVLAAAAGPALLALGGISLAISSIVAAAPVLAPVAAVIAGIGVSLAGLKLAGVGEDFALFVENLRLGFSDLKRQVSELGEAVANLMPQWVATLAVAAGKIIEAAGGLRILKEAFLNMIPGVREWQAILLGGAAALEYITGRSGKRDTTMGAGGALGASPLGTSTATGMSNTAWEAINKQFGGEEGLLSRQVQQRTEALQRNLSQLFFTVEEGGNKAKKAAEGLLSIADAFETIQGYKNPFQFMHDQMARSFEEQAKQAEELRKATEKIGDAMQAAGKQIADGVKQGTAGLVDLKDALQELGAEVERSKPAAAELSETYKQFGITSVEALAKQAEGLRNSEQLAVRLNKPLFETLQITKQRLEAELQLAQAQEAQPERIAQIKGQLEGVNEQLDGMKGKQREVMDLGAEMAKTFALTWDRMAQGIAQSITGAQTLGEVFTNVFRSIRDALIEMVVKALLIDLQNALLGVTGRVSELGKAFTSLGQHIKTVFGGGGAAAGSGAQAAGAAVGSITSVFSIVGTLTNMITGVLSFLQGRRMEQDIGRIEVTTRGMLNELLNRRSDAWAQHNDIMLKWDMLLDGLRGGGFSFGNGGQGPDEGGQTFTRGRGGPTSDGVARDLSNVVVEMVAPVQVVTNAVTDFSDAMSHAADVTNSAIPPLDAFGSSLDQATAAVTDGKQTYDELKQILATTDKSSQEYKDALEQLNTIQKTASSITKEANRTVMESVNQYVNAGPSLLGTASAFKTASGVVRTAGVVVGEAVKFMDEMVTRAAKSMSSAARTAGIALLPEPLTALTGRVSSGPRGAGISIGPSDLQYQGQNNIVINAPGAVFGQDAPQYFLDQVTELLRRDGRLG